MKGTAGEGKRFFVGHGAAWAAVFLLTVFLAITILSMLAVQMLTSAGLHLQAATDDAVIEEQLHHIYEQIDLLSEEYGFSADTVKATIQKDQLKEIDEKVASWFTLMLTEGQVGTVPRWDTKALEESVNAASEGKELKEDPATIVADLAGMIERTIMPMRETLLSAGMSVVKEKADVPGIVQTVRKLPVLCLMMSLLTAGVIALLLGNEIFNSLKYYGTAIAGGGLVIAATWLTARILQPVEMIRQASERLANETAGLTGKIALEAGGITLLLLVVGYLFLYLYRRQGIRRKTEQSL